MIQWQELQHREITKVDLRENYIATQSIVIQALARVGNYYFRRHAKDLDTALIPLENINWSRNSKTWYLRAIGKNGRVITNKKAALLIANVLKNALAIPLTADEQNAEEALLLTLNQ